MLTIPQKFGFINLVIMQRDSNLFFFSSQFDFDFPLSLRVITIICETRENQNLTAWFEKFNV